MLPTTFYEQIRANFKQPKLLIIDNDTDHSPLIAKAMQQCLPEVALVYVNQPDQAIHLLREWSTQEWELPKLILQDLFLPTRDDGWNVLRQIKALPAACNRIPVVILSSSSQRTDVDEAYQQGIASYLIKPVDLRGWLRYFMALRSYWWETATLPPVQFSV
ncbi:MULTISPECIES: response regulator [unclassified Spirosoma]|uniref:response regulator n=1 Tax=unclassified Spirosoma TaxID=2621999 RepID=UPI000962A509|nr:MULTISPECIES: response regulator [unclassified Spirosoma]MBN8822968.1 response regulator [Spirosoma sp.]OJW73075.1 MAG: response regulator [Spirosoma sp. 48-14]